MVSFAFFCSDIFKFRCFNKPKLILSSFFIELATMQNVTKLLLSLCLMILTLGAFAQKKIKI